MRGRRPIPTALKRARGNPGKRPLNEAELAPEPLAAVTVPAAIASGEDAAAIAKLIRDARIEAGGKNKKSLYDLEQLCNRLSLASAAEFWRVNAPRAAACGVLTEADVPAFTELCRALGEMTATELMVEKLGRVLTINGSLVANPYVWIAGQRRKVYLALLAQFGMTPSDRSRVSKAAGPAKANKKKGYFR